MSETLETLKEGAVLFYQDRIKRLDWYCNRYANADVFIVVEEKDKTIITPLAWAWDAQHSGWRKKTASSNTSRIRRQAERLGLFKIPKGSVEHTRYWELSLKGLHELKPGKSFSKRSHGDKLIARQSSDNTYYVFTPRASSSLRGTDALSPEELVGKPGIEGARIQVTTNRYERDDKLRAQSVAFHSLNGRILCAVCSFDFEEAFGALGKGFIHIHHVNPLGNKQEQHQVDPKTDLKPVCPNCHAMLHRKPGRDAYTIEELQRLRSDHGN